MNACIVAVQALTDPQWIEIAKLIVSVFTLMSIIIAYRSYRANLKKLNEDRVRERDKEFLAQAQKSLEWAYEVLTEGGGSVPPKANRLNWLTTARHLLRGRKIAVQIQSDTYKTVYAEIEEYWRHKVYVALSHDSLRRWTYYADQTAPEWPENIEISSALVVIDFSNWNENTDDPTDLVDRESLMKSGGGLKGGYAGRGLESYITRFEEIKAQRRTSK
jgi:hypothetical protein